MRMRRYRFKWFSAAAAAGFMLGAALLVESIVTYRYVTRHLVREHLSWQAGQHLSLLENRARRLNIETKERLRDLIEEICEERAGQIAWLRIVDAQGEILAQSGSVYGPAVALEAIAALSEGRAHSKAEVRSTPAGDVLVVALPLQYRLKNQQQKAGMQQGGSGRSSFNVAEMAVATRGPDVLFGVLQRNLAISAGSALALLISMAVVFARLPSYLRGRELEDQLVLARTVQQRLLPRQSPVFDRFGFAAECLPAYEVGGDYYDVFSTQQGQVALVLGDVSGKGLPAALLMAHIHGAVRSVATIDEGLHLATTAGNLNKLLSAVTSTERFASLFWAYYSPNEQLVRYVNAGHLAPLLVRRGLEGAFECHRLDVGGPVLGVLPHCTYEQGEVGVRDRDVLVLYSDGLAEATNTSDVEFGEERLLAVVEANWHRPVSDIQKSILDAVTHFRGGHELQDDLTLLVARVGPTPEGSPVASAELTRSAAIQFDAVTAADHSCDFKRRFGQGARNRWWCMPEETPSISASGPSYDFAPQK